MRPDLVAAIDVGGTTIKGALMGADGQLIDVSRIPTEAGVGPEQVVSNILAMARRLTAGGRATAIGLGVPGMVDEASGVAVTATNIRWRDVPLRALVAAESGLPVALGHDVRCGAVAEGAFGAARGVRDYLFVALGTGVGSGLVLDGKLYTGSAGLGGELGHVPVLPDGPVCLCGKRGCLEAIASAGAVARRYAVRVGAAPGSVSAEAVARRAGAGDLAAAAILTEAADGLGLALANYATLLNPGCIVIGGGLAGAGSSFLRRTEQEFRRWTDSLLHETPILPAQLGVQAGLVGAGLLAIQAGQSKGEFTHAG